MFNVSPDVRVAFAQFGDFRAADRRIRMGLGETYDAQRYSMEIVERVAAHAAATTVICVAAEEPHDERLSSGVRSIGLQNIWQQKPPFRILIQKLETLAPTHLVLQFPSVELLVWSRRRGVRVLPNFADSFVPRGGLRGWLDRWRSNRLAAELNHPSIEFVGNHNIAAAEALAAIGVKPYKIVPWDWPRPTTPRDFPVKAAPGSDPKRLIFVGTVSEAKGVGDILRMLAAFPDMGGGATLQIVGPGDIDDMRKLVVNLGLTERVTFSGRIPHADVAPAMHGADAVLVYSRHAYGEGLPGTIYLGLASRTPLVVSDHPMFMAYFQDGIDLLIARERAPEELANRLCELFDSTALYEALSRNSLPAFERIVHPVLWGDFVARWLRFNSEDRAWLEMQALPRWSLRFQTHDQ